MDYNSLLQCEIQRLFEVHVSECSQLRITLDLLKKENVRLKNESESLKRGNNAHIQKNGVPSCKNCARNEEKTAAAQAKMRSFYNKLKLIEQLSKSNTLDDSDSHEQAVISTTVMDSQVLKEVEELNSLELESQFVSDGSGEQHGSPQAVEKPKPSIETPGFVQETPPKHERPLRSSAAARMLDEIFGPISQSTSNIAAATSSQTPCDSIPQIVPQEKLPNERTPVKSNDVSRSPSLFSSKAGVRTIGLVTVPTSSDPQVVYDNASIQKSPIRVVASEKLLHNSGLNLLNSPRRNPPALSVYKNVGTPKRKRRYSPKKVSPRKTPSKGIMPLQKSRRIEAQISSSGVRRLTQTQLNVSCFKRSDSREIIETTDAVNQNEDSPQKVEEYNIEFSPPKILRVSPPYRDPSTPLTTIENHPDMDETRLSTSAVQRIADDVARTVLAKPALPLESSYNRLPEKRPDTVFGRKEIRKGLPAQECPECVKFYEHFGEDEGRREFKEKCSRHRTRRVLETYTPEGFWKPMITQNHRQPFPSIPSSPESPHY